MGWRRATPMGEDDLVQSVYSEDANTETGNSQLDGGPRVVAKSGTREA